MAKIWQERHKKATKKGQKKMDVPRLCISEAHSSRLNLNNMNDFDTVIEGSGLERRGYEEPDDDECDDERHGDDEDDDDTSDGRHGADADGELAEAGGGNTDEGWDMESAGRRSYAEDAFEMGEDSSGGTSANNRSGEISSAGQEIDKDGEPHEFTPVPLEQAPGAHSITTTTPATCGSEAPTASTLLSVSNPLDGSEAPLVDGPPTRIGRKRRVREWGIECECGERVAEDLRLRKQGVVQCKAKGCETGWVSVD
ncbi:hypothetical protein HWV62_22074 [Athelia sp. TMB]|nr:hypothetical protein HWV62_22074 [Athelia sp. TMB]